MHVCIYEMNIPVNLRYWESILKIFYDGEALQKAITLIFKLLTHIWGDHFFKWTKKKTLLMLSSILPFIVAVATLVEYSRSLISRPDLFCDGKYLVIPIFEASVQRVFKGFLWFFQLLYDTFYPFPGWIRIGCSKIASTFVLTFFYI